MARVRAVFIQRGVTWKFKVFKDEEGVTKYIYEPDGTYRAIRSDTKLTKLQIEAILDEQEFRWYNKNPNK